MAAISQNQVELLISGKPCNVEGSDEVDVLIRATPLSEGSRTPTHIVAVVDVSGSMSSIARVQNENGEVEDDGLSYLDVVKHATRTVIQTLGENDLFSLVSYHSTATVVIEKVVMSKAGKANVTEKLNALRPMGSTNIWDGLKSALDIIRRGFEQDPSKAGCIMLLTDGQPNMRPPRGEQAMLRLYKDENPNLRCTINTFGFGYNLNSPLLNDLADIGNGSYAFIPDSGFVGTIFVNSISNTLSNMASDLNVSIEPQNNATITKVYGGLPTTMTSWGCSIDLGSINYGQSRDVVVRMQVPDRDAKYLDATVTYIPTGATDAERITGSAVGFDNNTEVDAERFRGQFVDEVDTGLKSCFAGNRLQMDNLPQAREVVENLIGEMTNHESAQIARVAGLLEDITGQVTEAFSREDYFKKWGRHYIPSLLAGHKFQQCNNFKDPGVQFYGGNLFKDIQGQADKIFLGLPPPVPQAPKREKNYGGNSYTPTRTVNMNRYYNACSGCFDGFGTVQMADGSTKYTHQIRKGDQVVSLGGSTAEVVCVVQTKIAAGQTPLVTLPNSGLTLTPYHPILRQGEWVFPIDVASMTTQNCDMVYNFVLSNGHTMVIDGEQACTLGHGFTDNKVIQHAYFGTQAIIRDLQGLNGWSNGLITFRDNWLVVNTETNMLGGLKPSHELSVM